MADIDIFGKLKAKTQSGKVCDWNGVEDNPYTIVDTLPDNLTSADIGKKFLLKTTGELFTTTKKEVNNFVVGEEGPDTVYFDTSVTPTFTTVDDSDDDFYLLAFGEVGAVPELVMFQLYIPEEDDYFRMVGSMYGDEMYVHYMYGTMGLIACNEFLAVGGLSPITEMGWQNNGIFELPKSIGNVILYNPQGLFLSSTSVIELKKINELKVVSSLPTPTSTDIGNVFLLNTTGDMYVVEEQSPKPLSLSIGDTPPTTLYFDTSKTPDFSNEELLLQIGDAPYTEQGNSNDREIYIGLVNFLPYYDVQAIAVEYNMITTSNAPVIYVQSTLSLEEVNALAQEQFGITVSHFGWQNNGVLEFNEYTEEDGRFLFEVQEFDNSQNLLVINQEPTIGYKKLSSSSSKPEPLKVGDTFNMYDGIWFDNTREDILDILEGLSYDDDGQCTLLKAQSTNVTYDVEALSAGGGIYAIIEIATNTPIYINGPDSDIYSLFGGRGFLVASIADKELSSYSIIFTVTEVNSAIEIYKKPVAGTLPDKKLSNFSKNALANVVLSNPTTSFSAKIVINQSVWQNDNSGLYKADNLLLRTDFFDDKYNKCQFIVAPSMQANNIDEQLANVKEYQDCGVYLYATNAPDPGYFYLTFLAKKVPTIDLTVNFLSIVATGAVQRIFNTMYGGSGGISSEELDNKVDKVEGKGLSTNDYTNEDKAKVDGISNYTPNGGYSGTAQDLKTDISGLQTNISGLQTDISGLQTDIGNINTILDNINGEVI